jgi:hypothetical protein
VVSPCDHDRYQSRLHQRELPVMRTVISALLFYKNIELICESQNLSSAFSRQTEFAANKLLTKSQTPIFVVYELCRNNFMLNQLMNICSIEMGGFKHYLVARGELVKNIASSVASAQPPPVCLAWTAQHKKKLLTAIIVTGTIAGTSKW